MNSLDFSNFLFEKVQETINYNQYIKEIFIDYELTESFGNEYIRVTYNVGVNDDFYNLSQNVKKTMFIGKPSYIFTLFTYAESGSRDEKRKLLRITEFKHIYESLAIYVILQLENTLNPETSIKVKALDLCPEVTYAEKYLNNALYLKYGNPATGFFADDVLQWDRLHTLAIRCKKVYADEKAYFSITDAKINSLSGLSLDDIRFLLIRHEIPIKIKGIKTIDKVYVHTLKLVEALKKDIKDEYFSWNKILYKELITYLYNNHLDSEKLKIIGRQKTEFLQQFIIQKGDILQLKDGRIVVANSIGIDLQNAVIIEYSILKVNLQISSRKRKIFSTDVAYVLNEADFLEYRTYTPSKRISLLNKWMSKRKKKVDFIKFEPDLTAEIPRPII